MFRNPKLQKLLIDLFDDLPYQPSACAIITQDGLSIASVKKFLGKIWDTETDREEDTLSAMGAAILSLGERLSLELHNGEYISYMSCSEQGLIYNTVLDEDYVFSVKWSNGVTLPQLYQEWDALEEVIETLSKSIKDMT